MSHFCNELKIYMLASAFFSVLFFQHLIGGIGFISVAFGFISVAFGFISVAFGFISVAFGFISVAFGFIDF